ncbi:hypothetical protein C8R45DRAFT_210858 [Mycena sanguinolenta]|nr:hypothetical protein C8R45DRAFT_210858 [Mycena sanguinolenta]
MASSAGLVDVATYKHFPTTFPSGSVTCTTQCCHISPESAQGGEENADYVMALLKTFDFDSMSILGGRVNALHNVVTMASGLQGLWDDFAFWFEEVEPNTYDVVAANPSFGPSTALTAHYLHYRPRIRRRVCCTRGYCGPSQPSIACYACCSFSRGSHVRRS